MWKTLKLCLYWFSGRCTFFGARHFLEILWRKGYIRGKSLMLTAIGAVKMHISAANIKDSVLATQYFWIVIVTVFIKLEQICFYSRDCIILWHLINLPMRKLVFSLAILLLNTNFKLLNHWGMNPKNHC